MLADFLKLIQDTAVKAQAATILKTSVDARGGWIVQNGALTPVPIPPPLRDHNVSSVASLVEFCEAFAGTGSVWHDERQVIVVVDNEDRRDVATLPLAKSAPFTRLEALAKAKAAITQRDVIRLLRHDLRNAGVENVLSAMKRLDFKRTNDGKSHIEHGRESLGRSVEAAVNSAEAIPEFFLATVPVYTTPGADFHKTIYCTLEIDVATERFVVLPDEDSVVKAIQDAQADLHESLVESLGIPVYYGQP